MIRIKSHFIALILAIAGFYNANAQISHELPTAEQKLIKGTISIEKEGFNSEEFNIEILIEMEQIFPGMPTFYLINIVGALVLGLLSVLLYKRYRK